MFFFPPLVDAIDTAVRAYMRVQAYLKPVREGTTFFGAKFNCNIRDFIQRRIYFFSIYEPNLTYFVIDNVKPSSVFVDLGANIGYFSLLASKLVGPQGRVISIEAAPSTYAILSSNIQRNQCANVVAHNVAATGEPTIVEIRNVEKGNIGANAITRSGDGNGIQVKGYPLTDIVGDLLGDVTFIKIDIEGSEAPVLQDLLENADRLSPDITIVAEISRANAAFIGKFRNAGFRTAALPNNYRIGYTLIRGYLARTGEHAYTFARETDQYDPSCTDYVFARGNGALRSQENVNLPAHDINAM